MRAEMRRLLEAKIDQLPDGFRAVFVLRALEEMSVDEAAVCLGIASHRAHALLPGQDCCARRWHAKSISALATPLPLPVSGVTASSLACSPGWKICRSCLILAAEPDELWSCEVAAYCLRGAQHQSVYLARRPAMAGSFLAPLGVLRISSAYRRHGAAGVRALALLDHRPISLCRAGSRPRCWPCWRTSCWAASLWDGARPMGDAFPAFSSQHCAASATSWAWRSPIRPRGGGSGQFRPGRGWARRPAVSACWACVLTTLPPWALSQVSTTSQTGLLPGVAGFFGHRRPAGHLVGLVGFDRLAVQAHVADALAHRRAPGRSV